MARRRRSKAAPARRASRRDPGRPSAPTTPSTRARRSRASSRSASRGRARSWRRRSRGCRAARRRSRPTPASPSPTSSTRRPCARPTRCGTWATPAATRSRAARSPRCTAAGSGRCASSPGFGTPEDTNRRFKYLLQHGVTGLSTAFDMPALMGYDADHPMSRGEVGKEGVAVSSLRDFEILFDGIPLADVTTSMTINATAVIALAMYVAVGEKQGVPRAKLGGTLQNDMLKEYIAQKEWMIPPRAGGEGELRRDRVLRAGDAALEPGLDQRLPHPRGGGDGGPGARLHARGRHRVRAGVRGPRPRRGRLRAAPLVLLGRPQRLLRGGREVPRRPPHLGAHDEGALRGEAEGVAAPPHPRPDRRRLAHRAAALQQRGAHRAPGVRGGARRDAVAPHELARRDLRAPHRGGGHHRAAHPADHRLRVGRRPRRRPARRAASTSSGSPTRWSGAPSSTSAASTRWAACSARSRRATRSARSRRAPTAGSARSRRASGSSSA